MQAILDVIRAGAPYALTGISALCVAVMFWNLARDRQTGTQKTFGQWPDNEFPPSSRPAISPLDAPSRRVTLGLAAGAACGEAAFALKMGGWM